MVSYKNWHHSSLLIVVVSGIFFAVALTLAGVSNLAPYFKAILPGDEETYGFVFTGEPIAGPTTATISWETDPQKPVYASLYYKASNATGYSSVTACNLAGNTSPTSCTPYGVTLTGLTPDTIYNYYVELSAQHPATRPPPPVYKYPSEVRSFRTIKGARGHILDAKVTVVGTTATVTWSTPSPADEGVYYWGEDLTEDMVLVLGPQPRANRHTVTLYGLSDRTNYRYYATSTDVATVTVYNSTPQPFSTTDLDTTPPKVSLLILPIKFEQWAPGVNTFKATIKWTTNEFSSAVQVEWWEPPPANYVGPQERSKFSNANVNLLQISHVVDIGALKADTLYNYRLIFTDEAGNKAVSSMYSLQTPLPPFS